ncbi:MAG TPA: SOS response-associated peptidase [Halanaerobiales bacterium]|nr:SOS response-associated peptidase [Halanaerobiales bacterium]
MCGRYSLYIKPTDLALRYGTINNDINFSPKKEIYPGQNAPVITIDTKSNNKQLKLFNWGFSPSYTKQKIINARSETIDQKTTFKKSFKDKRCLIPATSFFEWKKIAKNNIKHEIYLKNQKIFSFAGIYDQFRDKDDNLITCYTIITTNANEKINNIHNRMPVILSKNQEDNWLKTNNTAELKKLLSPYNNNDTVIENNSDQKQLNLFNDN